MKHGRAALGFGAVLAAFGASIVLARVAPHDHKDTVVTSHAAAIAPRPVPPWARREPPVVTDLSAACTLGPRLFAVGAGGTVVRLDDRGAGFEVEPAGTARDLRAVAARDDGAVIAVGAGGVVARRDPASGRWAASTPLDDRDLFGVLLDADGAIAVGAGGGVYRESNGAWARESVATTAELRAVARDGRGYVAVGRGGVVVTSPAPGAPWTVATRTTARDLFAVVADAEGRVAYAFGDEGTILRRTADGAWRFDDGHVVASLRAATFAAAAVYALSDEGDVIRFSDGRWQREPRVPEAPVSALAFRLDTLWCFGARGGVLTRRVF